MKKYFSQNLALKAISLFFAVLLVAGHSHCGFN